MRIIKISKVFSKMKRTLSPETKEKMRIKALNQTEEHRLKNRLAHLNNRNPNWKGDKVSYKGIHTWLSTNFPKPLECKKCRVKGKNNKTKWSIHWCSKDHKYSRNKKDWIPLCAKCHLEYDIKNELREKRIRK